MYAEVVGRRGENVTLPCILKTKPSLYKVKWTKLEPENAGPENIIMISNAHACKPYGHLGARASLRKAHIMDASLQLSRLELEDSGTYRCELVNGIEDESVVIALRIEGNWCNKELSVYWQISEHTDEYTVQQLKKTNPLTVAGIYCIKKSRCLKLDFVRDEGLWLGVYRIIDKKQKYWHVISVFSRCGVPISE